MGAPSVIYSKTNKIFFVLKRSVTFKPSQRPIFCLYYDKHITHNTVRERSPRAFPIFEFSFSHCGSSRSSLT